MMKEKPSVCCCSSSSRSRRRSCISSISCSSSWRRRLPRAMFLCAAAVAIFIACSGGDNAATAGAWGAEAAEAFGDDQVQVETVQEQVEESAAAAGGSAAEASAAGAAGPTGSVEAGGGHILSARGSRGGTSKTAGRSRRETFMARVTQVAGNSKVRSHLSTVLLLCGLLFVFGVARWLNAEEVAAAARAAAAARREELQKSLDEYEKKIKESTDITKELAERKAEASRRQAEVQAAALEAEKAEAELFEQLSSQGRGGGELLQLVRRMDKEAEALEEETRVLQEKIKAFSDMASEDISGILTKTFEEQKKLAEKKRAVVERMAEMALLEARWGEALSTQGGSILEEIQIATQELEDLKKKKLELKKEKIENAKAGLSNEEKQETKTRLEAQVRQLRAQISQKNDERAEKEKEVEELKADLEERKGQLDELKREIQDAKAKKESVESDFETKRREFLDALAPLEQAVESREKENASLSSIRKDTGDRLGTVKEQLACKAIAQEALEQHKELEEYERKLAEEHVSEQRREYEEEISELTIQLSGGGLGPKTRNVLEKRIDFLKGKHKDAAEKALEEARRSGEDLFLTLESRCVGEHRTALGIFRYFDERIDNEAENPDLVRQFLVSQRDFEEKRLKTLNLMDRASEIARQRSFGQEIRSLFGDNKSTSAVLKAERDRIEGLLQTTRERLDTANRRRSRARRGLLSLPRHDKDDGSSATDTDPTGTTRIILKRRLLGENTLITFYTERIRRLEEALKDLDITYGDKLAAARSAWTEIKKDFTTPEARWEVAGATDDALKAIGTSEESLAQVEDYVEEDDEEKQAEEILKGIDDDGSVSDADLLQIPVVDTWDITEIIRRFAEEEQMPSTQGGTAEEVGDAASSK